MSSLENKIKEQYAARNQMQDLYNSDYSRLADEERLGKVKQLLQNYHLRGATILEIGAGQGDNVQIKIKENDYTIKNSPDSDSLRKLISRNEI